MSLWFDEITCRFSVSVHGWRVWIKCEGEIEGEEIWSNHLKENQRSITQQQGEGSEKYDTDWMQLNLQRNKAEVLKCQGSLQGHYPIYFPVTDIHTEKFVEQAHLETFHGAVCLPMRKVHQNHWVSRLQQFAKRLIKICYGCDTESLPWLVHHLVATERSSIRKNVYPSSRMWLRRANQHSYET